MAVSITSRRRVVSTNSSPFFQRFMRITILFLILPECTVAWDDVDLELFDLVEEIPQNFYEALGLDQSANSADIRRAYRRLSLLHHPDKSKEEDAEETFRKIVAVAEVLRDEDKRRRYDDILINGLPDWRQPVFYYRRVRKMGLLEATTLLSIILTVGHYIVIWSMYWERKFELESLIKPKREKKNKKASRSQDDPKPDAYAILEDQSFLPKPQITDCLPFKCYRLIKATILFFIVSSKYIFSAAKKKLTEKPPEEIAPLDESDGEGDEADKKPRVRQKINPALYEYDRDVSLDHLEALKPTVLGASDTTEEPVQKEVKNDVWSQEEVKLLIKSIAKYPGGTTDRWEKIAADIGRPVNVVSKKAKEIKNKGYATAVDASIQGITGDENQVAINKQTGRTDIDDISISSKHIEDQPITSEVASYDYFDEEDTGRKKRKNKTSKPSKNVNRTELIGSKPSTNGEMKPDSGRDGDRSGSGDGTSQKSVRREADDNVHRFGDSATTEAGRSQPTGVADDEEFDGIESGSWTQRQQKVLEKALQVFPKGAPERWDKIAASVPAKTKEECIIRYKELVETVRRKKQAADK